MHVRALGFGRADGPSQASHRATQRTRGGPVTAGRCCICAPGAHAHAPPCGVRGGARLERSRAACLAGVLPRAAAAAPASHLAVDPPGDVCACDLATVARSASGLRPGRDDGEGISRRRLLAADAPPKSLGRCICALVRAHALLPVDPDVRTPHAVAGSRSTSSRSDAFVRTSHPGAGAVRSASSARPQARAGPASGAAGARSRGIATSD